MAAAPSPKRFRKKLNSTGEAVAGGFAGLASRQLIAPLDVLKIRFQLQREPVARGGGGLYRSLLQSTQLLLAEEGFRALWRGNGAALALWGAYAAVQFPLYARAREVAERFGAPHALAAAAGGSIAGAAATLLTYPLDFARTRMASQGVPRRHTTYFQLLRGELSTFGPFALFRGVGPTLAAIIPQVAVTFTTYEYARAGAAAVQQRLLMQASGDRESLGGDAARAGPLAHLIGGAAAGTLGKLSVYPLDTVKKRAQTACMARAEVYGQPIAEYRGALHALRELAREDERLAHGTEPAAAGGGRGLRLLRFLLPPRAWFKGLGPSLLKAALSTAATFLAYEAASDAIRESDWAVSTGDERIP